MLIFECKISPKLDLLLLSVDRLYLEQLSLNDLSNYSLQFTADDLNIFSSLKIADMTVDGAHVK